MSSAMASYDLESIDELQETLQKTKKEVLCLQDKNEALVQENYELKKRIDRLERVNCEMDNEITTLTSKKDTDISAQRKLQAELECANLKIKQLETQVEEEKQNVLSLKEKSRKDESQEQKTLVVPDQEQLNILTGQINTLQSQIDTIDEEKQSLIEEKNLLNQQFHQQKLQNQALLGELSEVKEMLSQKSQDFKNLNLVLESTREEKMVLSSELSVLKSSDSKAARGNSLFAEVEENRQKMAAEREILKIKYMKLKNCLAQHLAENNKLKMEIIKIRRNEKEDEDSIHKDYSELLSTYKQKITELEERVQTLEKENPDLPPIPNRDGNNANYQWVNTVVEEARKKARTLQEELDFRGANYVVQGHKLFDSQKQNRKLKATVAKMQSDCEELKLQLEKIKTAQENEKDLISPPVLEEVTKYKKAKGVTFKEVLLDRSNSSHHSSDDIAEDNLNKSELNGEANLSSTRLKENIIEGEDKEN